MTISFPFGYLLYGLRIATNRPRPQIDYVASAGWPSVDMVIAFMAEQPPPSAHTSLPWRLLVEQPDPTTSLRIWAAATPAGLAHRLCLSSGDDYTEVIATPDAQGKPERIEVYWHNSQLPEAEYWHNAANWVFDVALSYVARLRIPANLHGSALAMDGKAIALVGSKGMGKSTLSAAMVAAGYALLTDDHVALWPRDGVFWVEPGAPRLRLWPTSLPILAVAPEDLPRVYTFVEKRFKYLHTGSAGQPAQFQPTPLPLAAIYLLEARDPTRAQAHVESLPPKKALHELWLRRYTTIALSQEHSAKELAVLAQIAQQVPICRVYRPDGLASLPQVIEAIRGHRAAATKNEPQELPVDLLVDLPADFLENEVDDER